MEVFYSDNVGAASVILTAEDSLHCARVLRHREGDKIHVIDGEGTMYECVVTNDNPKMVQAGIVSAHPQWHSHPYFLCMAVCPTKNNERFEWFVEKAVEVGLDEIAPVIGDRSERRVYKTERARKIVLSGAKQSLKAALPAVDEPLTVREFIASHRTGLRFIAYCFDDGAHPRVSFSDALASALKDAVEISSDEKPQITVLIGPEGDFSPEEAAFAIENGYIPVHLGQSRLRTETAALVAVTAVYLKFQ